MDEYVPTIIPQTSANENPFNTCPPKKNKDSAVSRVKPLVRMVRLNV